MSVSSKELFWTYLAEFIHKIMVLCLTLQAFFFLSFPVMGVWNIQLTGHSIATELWPLWRNVRGSGTLRLVQGDTFWPRAMPVELAQLGRCFWLLH